MQSEPIDLNVLYQTALAGIHRAYVFMRFGVRGVSIVDFEGTELPGRHQILIVPEPMPPEMVEDYLAQFRSWIIGNGLRELVETYCKFLDQVYTYGLEILSPADHEERQRAFEEASLREKIKTLWATMDIEGEFGSHLESFSAVQSVLSQGLGTVRREDCTHEDELVITWRAIDVYFIADNGVRYRIGDEPNEFALREPLETITVDREKRWKLGQKVHLSAHDLAEICYMANHDAVDVLNALRKFGLQHGVEMTPAKIVRGGEES